MQILSFFFVIEYIMKGGLVQLVAYGAQDVYLTGNPDISHFKQVFNRHTNFASESIVQTLDGTADFGKRVSCTIARNGDLVSNMYLEMVLPMSESTTIKLQNMNDYVFNDIEDGAGTKLSSLTFTWNGTDKYESEAVSGSTVSLYKSTAGNIVYKHGINGNERIIGRWKDGEAVSHEGFKNSIDEATFGVQNIVIEASANTQYNITINDTADTDDHIDYVLTSSLIGSGTNADPYELVVNLPSTTDIELVLVHKIETDIWAFQFNENGTLVHSDASINVDSTSLSQPWNMDKFVNYSDISGNANLQTFRDKLPSIILEFFKWFSEQNINNWNIGNNDTTALQNLQKAPIAFNNGGTTVNVVGTGSWKPNLGYNLISDVCLEIGGQQIDHHTSEWMRIWSELTLQEGRYAGHNTMVCKSGTLASDQKVIVPLHFWFCRHDGLSLPLIALQYHDVKVKIQIAEYADLVDSYTSVPSMKSAELWCDYVFLDTDERRRFAQESHEYLIEQVQSIVVSHKSGTLNQDLMFNHPCKEFIWRLDEDITYSKLGLMLNGNERFQPRSSNYFSLVQPYQHHTRIPHGQNIGVYSFSLKPEEHQPSGTCNMSRIDNVQLQFSGLGGSGNLHVYATNYNVLRITSGMGGLAFSN